MKTIKKTNENKIKLQTIFPPFFTCRSCKQVFWGSLAKER